MVNNKENLKECISEQEILFRIKEIAAQISKKYKNNPPIFICVLKGSFIFVADLIREMDIDCEIDFVQVSSYSGTKSNQVVSLKKDLSVDIRNRNVIIVEDIIDTGITINFLKKWIEKLGPKSISIATLLIKRKIANLNFKIDWVGFEIAPEFVVGYGLDFDQKLRNLRAIYVLGGNESE